MQLAIKLFCPSKVEGPPSSTLDSKCLLSNCMQRDNAKNSHNINISPEIFIRCSKISNHFIFSNTAQLFEVDNTKHVPELLKDMVSHMLCREPKGTP